MTIEYFWLEAIWILALIFANGFFAASEIACFVARPIEFLSRVTSCCVKALTASSNLVLRLFGGGQDESSSFISVDEVKSLIREGTAKGIFNETEEKLIHSVFEFTDTP